MIKLTAEQIASYWEQSFGKADGLWFMKVEEKYGFDVALDVDEAVWSILPKMQARMLKSMGGIGNGMDGLLECLTTLLDLEGFDLEVDRDSDGFTIVFKQCHWHDAMVKSGREQYSGRVGTRVCTTQYSVFAAEFGDDIRFELQEQVCKGAPSCSLKFSSASASANEG
ncbi:MAG: DUF6125 family protein [Chloroflexota bacterium]|nr:DUF6125 family protein [Chloroflexota bacterium]